MINVQVRFSRLGLSPEAFWTILLTNLSSLYKGQLVKQFIGQQLLAKSSGLESESLCFLESQSTLRTTAEVNNRIARGGRFIFKVNSRDSGSLKSLHILLSSLKRERLGKWLQSIHSVAFYHHIIFAFLYSILFVVLSSVKR
jgi:hypothetical protein